MQSKRIDNFNDINEEIHEYGIDVVNRQIYLHSHYENVESHVDLRMANTFVKNLYTLENLGEEEILIHQYSDGGDWTSGLMIYDAILNASCHISMLCHGSAMSMATIILQAADLRLSMPHCTFLLHEGYVAIDGTNKEAQSWTDFCKHVRLESLNIYANKCQNGEFFKGKTINQIKQYIKNKFNHKEDWIMTAEEALYYGFIDKILDKPVKEFVSRT